MINASVDKLPVAATQPIKGGKAPGKAPTKTAIDPFLLRGVYTKEYNTKDKKEINEDKTLK